MGYSHFNNYYLKNKIIHFLVFGSLYLNVEIFSRAFSGSLIGFNGISKWSLCGWTSLWMFPIGGLCGVIIGSLNDRPGYYNLKVWQQVVMGGPVITAIELLSGIFFNLYLHLNLWDYSQEKCNFIGQICLKNLIYWYLSIVIIIWFDDVLSYYFYQDERPSSLWSYFVRLVKLQ
ncbi:putative ABC transporter permease [Clostridium sp. JNZ X4-2]